MRDRPSRDIAGAFEQILGGGDGAHHQRGLDHGASRVAGARGATMVTDVEADEIRPDFFGQAQPADHDEHGRRRPVEAEPIGDA